MRIVKDAEERRNEIIDAADMLFGTKGYDKTSTQDILDKVKIARGTLYYHFKSKEDIMDALVNRYTAEPLAAAGEIASNKSMSVYERIIGVISSLSLSGEEGEDILQKIHKPQNILMHHKMKNILINNLTPLLAGVVRDGIEQGLFSTPFPYESVEMIVIYVNTVFDDDVVEISDEEMVERIKAFIFNLERLLGAEENSLLFTMQLFDDGDGDSNE